MANTPIIAFDYDMSPYGYKTRTLLACSNIPFQRSLQPMVIPRPILQSLSITYRRVPLLAMGKDVYCDSSLIVSTLQEKFNILPTSPADRAYEAFGNALFESVLSVIPSAMLTPDAIKDRITIFQILKHPDYPSLRPSGLAEVRAKFHIIETEFLAGPRQYIGGDSFALSDLHAGFAVGFALKVQGLIHEPGFGQSDFPRMYEWIAKWPKAEFTEVSPEEVHEAIGNAAYSAQEIGVDSKDPLGIAKGTEVSVESADADPGAHPQKGKLIGLNGKEVVLQLENDVRLHFPRVGYVVKES
ncbi:hypothetical protein G6011_06883 [Alternaria panax]|uniref:GST N-terminal domain-containing protein n=1 Tax=Alternaria panax TaxID=48097 RepID=A0AAD4F9B6_9PLEO|nr:hypothetical protein G6011_06883 [Alternaria panax]